MSRDNVCDVTLDLVGLKDPEEPGSQEAELSLTGVRESCNHLRHGGLPSDTGQAVIIGEQEPVKHIRGVNKCVKSLDKIIAVISKRI